MILGVVYIAMPLGLYLGLAALPPGRALRAALWSAGVVLATLWAAWLLGAGPFTGEPRADADLVAALGLWTLAAGLAALLQALRRGLGATGLGLAYPLAVAGSLALVLAALRPLVGV